MIQLEAMTRGYLFGFVVDRAAIFAGEDRFAISWPWAFKLIQPNWCYWSRRDLHPGPARAAFFLVGGGNINQRPN